MLNQEQRDVIVEFVFGHIRPVGTPEPEGLPIEEVFELFPGADGATIMREVVASAIESRDALLAEAAQTLAFSLTPEAFLTQDEKELLIREAWHGLHEPIVDSYRDDRHPRAVELLYRAAGRIQSPANEGLGQRVAHVLSRMDTTASRAALDRLRLSDDPLVFVGCSQIDDDFAAVRVSYDDRHVSLYTVDDEDGARRALAGDLAGVDRRGRELRTSFLETMNSSWWGRKPGHDCVLRLTISRATFDELRSNMRSLALFDPPWSALNPDERTSLESWPSDRDGAGVPMPWRTLRISVPDSLAPWLAARVLDIDDMTRRLRSVNRSEDHWPVERLYPRPNYDLWIRRYEAERRDRN